MLMHAKNSQNYASIIYQSLEARLALMHTAASLFFQRFHDKCAFRAVVPSLGEQAGITLPEQPKW